LVKWHELYVIIQATIKPKNLLIYSQAFLDEMMKKNKPKEEKKIATVRRIDG